MNRRRALGMLGTLAGAGIAGRYLFLPPSRSRSLQTAHQLALEIFDSLDGESRKLACVPYDHPLRQYHNRGVSGGGVRIYDLDWDQRAMLTDLLYAGLSKSGQERIPNEYFARFPGVHLMKLLFCGDPEAPPYQILLTGPHLNLRIGGKSREGVAFGGPQVYGDQRGDGVRGLPGNLYREQLSIGRRLVDSLRAEERTKAIGEVPPIQTQIELSGRAGSFTGVSVADLSPASKAIGRELITAMLSTYPDDDVAYANACLDHNGGIDALFFSTFGEQIFRLEGPAAVLYFRGEPHVHAFINIAMDGESPLSVGDLLGDNPAVLEGDRVKTLFEDAMLDQFGTDLAYYDRESVVGRLRPGPIRSGDIYNLESWQNAVALVEIKGADLPAPLRADRDPARTYSLATTDDTGATMLRDVTIAYLKKHGFPT